MPLRAHHLPPRSTAPNRPTRAVADVPFDDLVYLLAAGVADAQTALDAHTVETLDTLAETAVDVVPSITRTIESDGSVRTETASAESRSLLELGITPARYQFSDATVEVEVDVSVTERTGRDDEATRDHTATDDRDAGGRKRPFGLRAGTQAVIDQRRFDRTIGANARLAARLEPTPLPTRLETTDGGEDAN
jgi:hypothetical protein